MNCLEFKRIALSDPRNQNANFVEHVEGCPDCLKYVNSIIEMDSKLSNSLDVKMPEDIKAKLELNQLLSNEASKSNKLITYAKAASIAAIMLVSGYMLNGHFSQSTDENLVAEENTAVNSADEVIVQLINHLDSEAVAPIWKPEQANFMMKNLMARYDPNLKFKELSRLQFSEICPLNSKLRALHANLGTDHGQTTFAYIKGYPVVEVRDASYKGLLTRIKPIRDGSLVIISHNMYAMEDADKELESALYWDI